MKIGVLADSFTLPKWKYKVLEDLSNNQSVDLYLIKIHTNNTAQKLNNLLFYLYENFDYRFFSSTGKFKETIFESDASQKIDLTNLKYKFDDEVTNFDLIIDLTESFNKNFYKVYNARSKKGICFFEFGEQVDSYPPFFREIYFNLPTINVYLSITDGKYKKTLYKSTSGVFNFSLHINNNKSLWKMSDFINRTINKFDDIDSFSEKDKLLRYDAKFPSNFLMIKFIIKIINNLINTKIHNSKFKTQWFLAYQKKQKHQDILKKEKLNFNIITPPDDKFYADPFIVSENGKNYVFFEEYFYLIEKGVISCFELGEDGPISSPKVVLEKDYHLSYPFVFKYENKYYMLPETLGNQTIELYEATDFPEKWELKKVLFDNVNAVDNTITFYKGKFWLFSTMSQFGNALSDELYIYYSDSPLGEWKPHAKNPVISNTKTARPAGKLFCIDDKLIRPSQKNSIRYGYALNFNRIDVLTEYEYKETLLKTINPEFIRDNLAIHTYNSNDKFEIIDGMRLLRK